jgi:hypothetical protein
MGPDQFKAWIITQSLRSANLLGSTLGFLGIDIMIMFVKMIIVIIQVVLELIKTQKHRRESRCFNCIKKSLSKFY